MTSMPDTQQVADEAAARFRQLCKDRPDLSLERIGWISLICIPTDWPDAAIAAAMRAVWGQYHLQYELIGRREADTYAQHRHDEAERARRIAASRRAAAGAR